MEEDTVFEAASLVPHCPPLALHQVSSECGDSSPLLCNLMTPAAAQETAVALKTMLCPCMALQIFSALCNATMVRASCCNGKTTAASLSRQVMKGHTRAAAPLTCSLLRHRRATWSGHAAARQRRNSRRCSALVAPPPGAAPLSSGCGNTCASSMAPAWLLANNALRVAGSTSVCCSCLWSAAISRRGVGRR